MCVCVCILHSQILEYMIYELYIRQLLKTQKLKTCKLSNSKSLILFQAQARAERAQYFLAVISCSRSTEEKRFQNLPNQDPLSNNSCPVQFHKKCCLFKMETLGCMSNIFVSSKYELLENKQPSDTNSKQYLDFECIIFSFTLLFNFIHCFCQWMYPLTIIIMP